jgi:gluconolactonase
VDQKGNLFATGPGGVLVFSPQGKHLGTLQTGEATSNCAWGDDGTVLYVTVDMYLVRIRTATKGKGF